MGIKQHQPTWISGFEPNQWICITLNPISPWQDEPWQHPWQHLPAPWLHPSAPHLPAAPLDAGGRLAVPADAARRGSGREGCGELQRLRPAGPAVRITQEGGNQEGRITQSTLKLVIGWLILVEFK